MSGPDAKADLHRYLQVAPEALLWKLEGLSEYDIRRPMVRTETNLLGLVKHLAGVEAGYFGEVFDRPFDEPLPWTDEDGDPNADMWATADESREQIVALYRRVWTHADATIERLDLDSLGRVPWWPPDRSQVTLHRILVHVATETHPRGARGHRSGTHRRCRRIQGRQRQPGPRRRHVVDGVPQPTRAGGPALHHVQRMKAGRGGVSRNGMGLRPSATSATV